MKTIEDLRQALFKELEDVQSGKADRERLRLVVAISEQLIDSARVEVQLSAVLRGALDIPFIEDQTTERPAGAATQPPRQEPPPTPVERMAKLLGGGPHESHPWKKSLRRERK